MDFDTGLLSLIDGYVSDAMNTTGTKRALSVAKPEQQFEGDTIPDVMPVYAPRIEVPEDFDEIQTGVVVQQRLIR